MGTPIGDLIEYHNLGARQKKYDHADLLIGMCMDFRKRLEIPDNFAFIIRTGGANLSFVEFNVAYALSVANLSYIALIGHDDCGMSNLHERKEPFIQGMSRFGWDQSYAADYYDRESEKFEVYNEPAFIVSQAKQLRKRFSGVTIAPMMYLVGDRRLYQIDESSYL